MKSVLSGTIGADAFDMMSISSLSPSGSWFPGPRGSRHGKLGRRRNPSRSWEVRMINTPTPEPDQRSKDATGITGKSN
jgi:hypothetical protein